MSTFQRQVASGALPARMPLSCARGCAWQICRSQDQCMSIALAACLSCSRLDASSVILDQFGMLCKRLPQACCHAATAV